MAIRIALIDDQTLIREGISSLLQLSGAVEIIAEGSDGDQVLKIVNENAVDIILMDISMPRLNGIEAIRSLKEAGLDTPVILLTTFDDSELVLEGLQAGARGYLLKDVSLENLISAIEAVHKGETIVQPALNESLLRGIRSHKTQFDSLPDPEPLSSKESEILRLIANGFSNEEIATTLNKSGGTVKNQVSNILGKLGVRDRTRAVLRAIELGLIG